MWPWVEVRRSPRRRAGFTKRSSALAPTGDDHPSEISVSPSAYEIIAPTGDDHPSEYEVPASSSSTASITKDASFSTSRKAETKRARRKRTEESRRLRMLKKGNEKRLREEGRKSISTEPPKTSPQSHKGYSLDFGCCLNAPMAAQRPGRSKLSVCHKGLSGEFGCRFDIPMTEQLPPFKTDYEAWADIRPASSQGAGLSEAELPNFRDPGRGHIRLHAMQTEKSLMNRNVIDQVVLWVVAQTRVVKSKWIVILSSFCSQSHRSSHSVKGLFLPPSEAQDWYDESPQEGTAQPIPGDFLRMLSDGACDVWDRRVEILEDVRDDLLDHIEDKYIDLVYNDERRGGRHGALRNILKWSCRSIGPLFVVNPSGRGKDKKARKKRPKLSDAEKAKRAEEKAERDRKKLGKPERLATHSINEKNLTKKSTRLIQRLPCNWTPMQLKTTLRRTAERCHSIWGSRRPAAASSPTGMLGFKSCVSSC